MMNIKNNNRHENILVSVGMVAPALVLYLLFQIWPLLGGFYYSLTDWDGIAQKFNFVGIANYVTLAHDSAVLVPLKNTFFFAFWSMLFLNVLALAFAIGLNREIKGKNFLRACLFLPAMLAPLVVGYVFSFIFSEPVASLGKLLGSEVMANNLIGSLTWSLPSVVVGATWRMTGWYMVVYLAGLQTIPTELYEAGDIDGVGAWKRFLHITFPLIAPAFTINMVLSLERAFKEYDMVFSMTGGGPGNSSELLALTIYNESFSNHRGGYGSAIGILLFALIVLLTFIQMHWLRGREDNARS
jgi:raffinose/stachyose/melibiose transport system permease protein